MNPDNSIKLPLTTPDIASDRLDQLKTLFPEAFCDGQLDSEKLKHLIGQDHHVGPERYSLTWAGKSDAIRSLQIPSHATLRPMKEESVNFDTSENMIIEGDNLEVLKLLQRSYHGKIKMIYIDPPYNTGNDFIYPDNFKDSLGQYLKYSGQVGDDGIRQSTNSETNGRYHSNWLNMMYPRLFLAKNLLKDDGVIFVSIDDHEQANLKLIMDEIFGEENFVAQYIWKARSGRDHTALNVSISHEYILCFAKNLEITNLKRDMRTQSGGNFSDDKGNYRRERLRQWGTNDRREDRPTMYYPVTTPNGEIIYPIKNDGTEGCWRISETRMLEMIKNDEVDFVYEEEICHLYAKKYDGKITSTAYGTILDDVGSSSTGTLELKDLFSSKIFDTTKPSTLISRLINLCLGSNNDIILDFFSGSGSLAHSILDLNKEDRGHRKFICVQLPEPCDEKSEASKAGFKTIADITRERVRCVIQKIQTEQSGQLAFDNSNQDLGFKAFRLDSSNFKLWDGTSKKTPEELAEALTLFADNIEDGRTQDDMLFEIILKAGQSLTAKIEKIVMGKQSVYSVSDGAMLVCLEDPIQEETLRAMLDEKPAIMIALDRAFHGNDQLKTNIKLQAEQSGESDQSRVVFRTV